MSLGTWDPDSHQDPQSFQITLDQLKRFIDIGRSHKLDSLTEALSAQEQQQYAPIMQQDQQHWFSAVESFSDEEVIELMRFFTKAEQLPGWECGAKSPVIWLGKVLKKRGIGVSRDLALWIKSHSNNQFLPHGSL